LHNDVSGNLTQITKVPLTYSPKDKMLARVIEDANIDRPVSLQLPMMSFEMVTENVVILVKLRQLIH
jgi:hypothetical protein